MTFVSCVDDPFLVSMINGNDESRNLYFIKKSNKIYPHYMAYNSLPFDFCSPEMSVNKTSTFISFISFNFRSKYISGKCAKSIQKVGPFQSVISPLPVYLLSPEVTPND